MTVKHEKVKRRHKLGIKEEAAKSRLVVQKAKEVVHN